MSMVSRQTLSGTPKRLLTFLALLVRSKFASFKSQDIDTFADFNKDQRGQIQAVLANVETMQPAFFLNPFGHSLQVRTRSFECLLSVHRIAGIY